MESINIDDHILKSDLTDDLLLICELCGLEAAVSIGKNFAGCSLYIPSTAFNRTKRRLCKELKRQGYPIKKIARLLDFSERTVRDICKHS